MYKCGDKCLFRIFHLCENSNDEKVEHLVITNDEHHSHLLYPHEWRVKNQSCEKIRKTLIENPDEEPNSSAIQSILTTVG